MKIYKKIILTILSTSLLITTPVLYAGSSKEAPEPSSEAVYNSKTYRNLFLELGKTETEVNEKLDKAVKQLFYGSDNETIYYPSGTDKAYILTADTNDVRSEGMSYGMMICVQMNMKKEFDALWNWANTYMQHKTGDRKGYFSWQMNTDGTTLDQNPAPDGEEYFAMSLFMASNLWGDGEGIYNYRREANYILDNMLNHRKLNKIASSNLVKNMVDANEKQVVFVPYGDSAKFSDPSYHLPHFYELFARWADVNNETWSEMATTSRELFQKATNPTTGLAPDYSNFDGTPKEVDWSAGHGDFRFDAWRVAQNIALDSYWWNVDPWQRTTWVKNYLDFFANEGVSTHGNLYTLDGKKISSDHSPGLVAMNATAALISDDVKAWDFVEELWNTSPPSGKYRYYDGCLYLFGLLNVCGKYQIIEKDGGETSEIKSDYLNEVLDNQAKEENANEKPYTVDYSIGSWGTGGTVAMKIKNNNYDDLTNWKLSFDFPGDQKITNMWNGEYTQTGNSVTIKGTSSSSTIPAYGGISIGFNISYSGTNVDPTEFVLD